MPNLPFFKMERHRADYASPPPPGLVTREVRYLTEIVEEFGKDAVAAWDRIDHYAVHEDLHVLSRGGETFHAERLRIGDESVWRVYRGGHIAARRPKPLICRVHPRARKVVVGGALVRSVGTIEEVEDLVADLAPRGIPEGWSWDEWRLRN